ncbi:MAG: energy transducer TonB [Lysobacter sp.]
MAHTLAFPAHPGQRQTGRTQVDMPWLALDGTRIAANAGAIAINTVALLLLLAPVSLPPPAPLAERDPDISWVRPKPEPKPIQVPVVSRPHPRQPAAAAQPRVAPAQIARPLVDSEPGDEALPATEPVVDAEPGDPVDLAPQPAASAQLQPISAPSPRYPPEAIRGGLTGTVELEILVGTDGKPLEVRVVRSSGHRLLDQAARKIVLSQWRFLPAMRDGRPVQALGRVPIAFTLER